MPTIRPTTDERPVMSLSLRQIRYFAATAESGQVSQAASKLGVEIQD